jgi:hypothetical protein
VSRIYPWYDAKLKESPKYLVAVKLIKFVFRFFEILFAGAGIVFVSNYIVDEVDIRARISPKFENPYGNGYVQVLTIENAGDKKAENLIITINCPKMPIPLDYNIRTNQRIFDMIRSNDELQIRLEGLPHGDKILISIAVFTPQVNPNDIIIIHNDGVVEQRKITIGI